MQTEIYSNVWSMANTIQFGKRNEREREKRQRKNPPSSKRLVDLPTFTDESLWHFLQIFVLSS